VIMTDKEFAEHLAEQLLSARDQNQAVTTIADRISRAWWERPGNPRLTYEEKLRIVDMIGDIADPPRDEMTHVGGDNSRTMFLIRAIRGLVK